MFIMSREEYVEELLSAFTPEVFFATFGITYEDAEKGMWNINLEYVYNIYVTEETYSREKNIKEISKNNCFIEFTITDTNNKEQYILKLPNEITENTLDNMLLEYIDEFISSYCHIYDYVNDDNLDDYDLRDMYNEYVEKCMDNSSYRELFIDDTKDLEYLMENYIE